MDSIITTAECPAPQRKASRRRPAVLVAGALLVAMLTLGAGTSAAGAFTIGGNGASGVPGTTYSTVYCKRGSITVAPQAAVQSGMSSQYISYRYYLTNNKGYRGTSGWSGATRVYNNSYLWSPLPAATIGASLNTVWWVQVQYAYWQYQSGRWVVSYYSNWQPATYVVSSGLSAGSSYTTNACYT